MATVDAMEQVDSADLRFMQEHSFQVETLETAFKDRDDTCALFSTASRFRLSWTLLRVLLLAYNAWMIPFLFAFRDDQWDVITGAIGYVGDVFFVVDAILRAVCFTTICFEHGQIKHVTNRATLGRRFVRSPTCATYVLGLVPVDLFCLLAKASWRTVYGFRFNRLLLLYSFFDSISYVASRLNVHVPLWRTRSHVIRRAARTVCNFLFILHMLACMWYYLGRVLAAQGATCWMDSKADFLPVYSAGPVNGSYTPLSRCVKKLIFVHLAQQ